MCFYVDPNHSRVKVASKDIFCWKVSNRKQKRGKFKSLHEEFYYDMRRKYYDSNTVLVNDELVGKVDRAYHSYSDFYKASLGDRGGRGFNNPFKFNCFVLCIIPKGSRYAINPDNKEYISDTIILLTKCRSKRAIKFWPWFYKFINS